MGDVNISKLKILIWLKNLILNYDKFLLLNVCNDDWAMANAVSTASGLFPS